MPVRMARRLVAAPYDFGHEAGTALGDPAEDEAGRFYAGFIEEIEQPSGIRFHTAGVRLPVLAIDNAGERLDMKVIFDVDTQNISLSRRFQVPIITHWRQA